MEILPVSEIAKLAHTSKHRVYEWIHSGKLHAIVLPPSKPNGKISWRVPLSSWQEFIAAQGVK